VPPGADGFPIDPARPATSPSTTSPTCRSGLAQPRQREVRGVAERRVP